MICVLKDFRQFFTLYPHTPDNSFLGHVVDVDLDDSQDGSREERKVQAVVYGKEGKQARVNISQNCRG